MGADLWERIYMSLRRELASRGATTSLMPLEFHEEEFDPDGPWRLVVTAPGRLKTVWVFRGRASWYLGTWDPKFFTIAPSAGVADVCMATLAVRGSPDPPEALIRNGAIVEVPSCYRAH